MKEQGAPIRLLWLGAILLLGLVGCGLGTAGPPDIVQTRVPVAHAPAERPWATRLHEEVRPALDQYLADRQASTVGALAEAKDFPAAFKRPTVLQALIDPWTGMTTIEDHVYRMAERAGGGPSEVSALLDVMESGIGRASAGLVPPSLPRGSDLEGHLAFLMTVLDRARRLREEALGRLGPEEQQFLFDHAAAFVDHFYPHVGELSDDQRIQVRRDRRFVRLVEEGVDMTKLVAAAKVLVWLADAEWLGRLQGAFARKTVSIDAPAGDAPAGVTGDLLLARETPSGLIVIGGPGPNGYELGEGVALVIDVGGDDVYRGAIGAAFDVLGGNRVVIDLSGEDTYHAAPLGLATGRLGVGLLVERSGNDVYYLGQGSGGTGFAGVGILLDRSGDDRYVGAKMTQGAAIGGLGLLVDESGRDRYTSFGYALGFGGPLGVGAVVEVEGDDDFHCGGAYPSSYNAADAPDSRPGDPLFQYDGFCMGVGSGKRVLARDPDQRAYGLAGGWGLLIDLQGQDRYRSANFSQGAGYFFGAGVKVDMGGDDEHGAARYGHGAGAHFGVGLFIDGQGNDRYSSSGPVYNAATAWDRSVTLCIDAGVGDDLYDFSGSNGAGRADHHSWSVFVEEAGRDRYLVPEGMGAASDNSLSAFFDLHGMDTYGPASNSDARGWGNGRTQVREPGGLFVDR